MRQQEENSEEAERKQKTSFMLCHREEFVILPQPYGRACSSNMICKETMPASRYNRTNVLGKQQMQTIHHLSQYRTIKNPSENKLLDKSLTQF